MEIITRLKTIKLSEEERKKIEDATDILIKVMYEIDDCSCLFGYDNTDWDKICKGLENVVVTGKFEIE